MSLSPKMYFSTLTDDIKEQIEEEIVSQTDLRLSFENGQVYTLLEKETEIILKEVPSRFSCALVEITTTENEVPEGYTCYLQTVDDCYAIDLTLVGATEGNSFVDIYTLDEIEDEVGYRHIDLLHLSPKECATLYLVTQQVLAYIEELPAFRMYFVTGFCSFERYPLLANLKQKADLR